MTKCKMCSSELNKDMLGKIFEQKASELNNKNVFVTFVNILLYTWRRTKAITVQITI